jgi:hypothetical protein
MPRHDEHTGGQLCIRASFSTRNVPARAKLGVTTLGRMTPYGQIPARSADPIGLSRVDTYGITAIRRSRTPKCFFMAVWNLSAENLHQRRTRRDQQQTTTSKAKKEEKKMNLFKAATTVGCMALMGAILAPNARADDWNRETVITFSGPVEIPGVHLKGWAILPAGTYVFKILDSQSDRHIVQIFNKEKTTVYATILAIPNFRLQATDKTVITFRERPAGQPEALRAWFYPGRNWGEEFVYPKAMAIEIAKATNLPVLFTPAEIAVEVAEPVKSADEAVVVELKQAPVMAVTPAGEEVQIAQVVTPPPVQAEVAPEADRMLPATASPFPLVALLGFLALCGAFMLRRYEKRIQ